MWFRGMTTYKTRVALEKPCKERKRTLIGQLATKDSEHCRACLAAEQVRHRSDPNVNVTRVVVPDTQHAVRIVEREPRLIEILAPAERLPVCCDEFRHKI